MNGKLRDRFSKELAGAEGEIKAEILKLVKENKKKLMGDLKFASEDEWETFVKELGGKLDDFVTVIQ